MIRHADGPRDQHSVLFIGDSLTYSQGGVGSHFRELARSDRPPIEVSMEQCTQGGAFLHRLWDWQETQRAIAANAYDVVVLQEDLPETTVADFREYARKFVAEVRKARARPIFFMAWAYRRLGWISMDEIAKAHRDVGRELDVEIAPVGLAWLASMRERPSLNLFDDDEEHPSISGTYLAACVIYATVHDRVADRPTYRPESITADEAAFLRRTAWQAVHDHRRSTGNRPTSPTGGLS